ncbi:MAG TPA: alpha/beta hydrolase [Caulobacteraceae bacterium]
MTEDATPAPDPRMDVYARPQTLVRIGRRRRLNVRLTGEGAPTVILSAGGGGSTIHWLRVQEQLSRTHRVLSFDRAGMGFSDPGPAPRTTGRAVDDLRAALSALGVPPPYVLVGHSMGSFDARLFTFRHPEEVLGLVLVDPRGDRLSERLAAVSPGFVAQYREEVRGFRRNAAIAARRPEPGSPEYQALVPPDDPRLTPAVNAAFRNAALRPSFWRTIVSEGENLDTSSAAELARARRPLGIMPLIVLTASQPPFPGSTPDETAAVMNLWKSSHDELAGLSDKGVRRDVPNVGHMIPTERPEVVVDAIREVVADAVREQRRS